MKDEYSFKGGERGKFHHADAQFQIPVYLEEDVLSYLSERAQSKGLSLTELVNELLKKEIAVIETVR